MQNFSARETEWLLELDGVELAGFSSRASAFLIDVALAYVGIFCLAMVKGVVILILHAIFGSHVSTAHAFSVSTGEREHVLLPGTFFTVLYFGVFTWRGKGRSPGKKMMGIRVVSLVHRHLSLWHAIERSLGYGAAFLEGGFGFFQFFIHPYRRTIQDRIAETIVVTERGYQTMQHKLYHPLLPDVGNLAATHLADEIVPPPPPPLLDTGATSLPTTH
jgi:uncharacterized RDD family membrane protein YckC